MSAPNTRNWNAIDNRQPPIKQPSFRVTGEVETNGGDQQPKLTRRVPQGINPHILMLDLTIEQSGDGGTDDVAYRDVTYEESGIEEGQYKSVSIMWKDNEIASVEVQTVH